MGGQPIVVLWQVGTASALDAGSVAGGRDVGTAAAYRREHAGRTLSFARAGERLKEAVVATVSTRNQCPWCIDIHSMMLAATGSGTTLATISCLRRSPGPALRRRGVLANQTLPSCAAGPTMYESHSSRLYIVYGLFSTLDTGGASART